MTHRIELIEPLLTLDMSYIRCGDNRQTNIMRRRLTILLIARFRIISATLVQQIYNVTRAKALEHLNKLVQEGLATLVKTPRSPDGRVYVLTHSGAKFAEELMQIQVPFRSQTNPSMNFNANSVQHDLILMHVCMLTEGNRTVWDGFISEFEFKRIYPANDIRNIDALVRKDNELIAIEVENSYKPKSNHENNLVKMLHSIKLNIYTKIFFISPLQRILLDTKRFHRELLDELPVRKNPQITKEDAELLRNSLVYRTKFCESLSEIFYP